MNKVLRIHFSLPKKVAVHGSSQYLHFFNLMISRSRSFSTKIGAQHETYLNNAPRTLWTSSSEKEKDRKEKEGTSGAQFNPHEHDHSKLLQDKSSQLMVDSPFGVMTEDKTRDIELLVQNFTAPALAAALRDREQTLHLAATLLAAREQDALKHLLEPFHADNIRRRRSKKRDIDVSKGFKAKHLHMLRKYLHRMPRHINRQTGRRASVLVPLCNIDGQPAVLFTKRSEQVRSHKSQVCFPGGNVDDHDDNIVETCLREMEEEIGISQDTVEILGVLRCDWSEIVSIVGMAVTPVVGFVHNISAEALNPNPDEVAHCFTVPLSKLLDSEAW
eukprot:CAMPEP_0117742612 /NCGR_PEP_ID=MMETSP0947-20121206/5646_1 /TAXON_ID=44440 /ORGANISM="Chattonella subsalsa, Strain CCMP2191" /LENGTH=330 /DNA_ID=CAMNT_0005559161 /DNA_START=108 /DNA_END=1097 /DNA_ORIENTATION=-